MKLHQQIALKQTQSLKLTPQLQQAVRILQANQTEISQLIEEELMENPVLEAQTSEMVQEEKVPETTDLLSYVKEYEKYFQESQGPRASTVSESSDGEESSFEEYVSTRKTLPEMLEEQFHLSTSDPLQRKIGTYLIASLDPIGYLRESTEKIAISLMVDEAEVERAVTLLQSFEPSGIGARDLRECLLLQYHAREMNDHLVFEILDRHIEDLGANRMKEIQKSTGASFEAIDEAIQRIRKLHPRPASGYLHEASTAEAIQPDVFVELEDEDLKITLNDSYLPNLQINPYYQEKIQNAAGLNRDELIYLKRKLEAALWFRQCIEKRSETILMVARCIFERQKAFFTRGLSGLRPMTLSDVATRIDRHEATVSRVINGKYAHTPMGLFELKFFFSGGLKSDQGDLVSSKTIKEVIQQAIAQEDPQRPVSDQTLAELLKAKGIDIARRTITKYREMLGITSSSKRKKYV